MNGLLIGIEPVIVRVGPLTIRWFGLLLIAAVVVGVWMTLRRTDRLGVPSQVTLDLASWILPLGFIGSRLLNLFENWEYYATRPGEILDFGAGGLSVWGGLAAGGLCFWVLGRRHRLPLARLADSTVPGLCLAEAVGRLGCFLNGDGQGLASSLPWATRYTSNNALTPDFGVPRHPAQIYQGLVDLAILGCLWLVRDAELPAGFRFWLWLGLYGLSRVVIGLIRLDTVFLFGLQQAQLLGLAAIALGVFGIIATAFRQPTPAPAIPR